MTRIILITVVFFLARNATATEQCPAINCDCDALPETSWVAACQQHESVIKQRCADNDDTPADYCLVHGLNAFPLPLTLKQKSIDTPSDLSNKELLTDLGSMNRSIAGYLAQAKKAALGGNYSETLKQLKLADSLVELTFEQQQLIEFTLKEKGSSDKKIRNTWKKSIVENDKIATSLDEFGEEFLTSLASAETEKQQKIYRVLAQKCFRIAGKRYEHTGYSQGKAQNHKKAAQSWQAASSISSKLIAISRSGGAQDSRTKFSEFQTAARLQRASLHWMLDKKDDIAMQSLQLSQQYIDREGQHRIDAIFNDDATAEPEQAITER